LADSYESVEFMAKYKDWAVIRKMTIYDDSTPQEIAFHLASIRQTIDRKAFEFLEIDMQVLDNYAASVTKDLKKNFDGLGDAIKKLGLQDAKKAIESACIKKPEHANIAKAYLLRKTVQNLGFDFDVNQEMLSKIYPELKIKKPPGRMPKK
jgi:hypothetical protein